MPLWQSEFVVNTNELPNPTPSPTSPSSKLPNPTASPTRPSSKIPSPTPSPTSPSSKIPNPLSPCRKRSCEQLDEEEKEFRALRRDLPGVKGASAAGIVAISVGKTPAKNEFFRSHKEFRPIVPIVDIEVGMERQFFAVTNDMVEALRGIGITVTDHVSVPDDHLTRRSIASFLFAKQTRRRAERIPSHQRNRPDAGASTNGCGCSPTKRTAATKSFPRRPAASPIRPGRTSSRREIFKLAFRDKGRLLDSIEHPLFKKWAARDSE